MTAGRLSYDQPRWVRRPRLAIAASLLAGAAVAAILRLPDRVRATITAFGEAILLVAGALELVPDADAQAGVSATGMLAGALLFIGRRLADPGRDHEAMRRSAHAAAARQDLTMTPDQAKASRGLAVAARIFVDGVPPSPSPSR